MNVTSIMSDIRSHCLECDGAKKLVNSHCTNGTCKLFKYRRHMLDASNQCTLFTYAGFIEEVNDILLRNHCEFLDAMFFSEIREKIETELRARRAKVPDGKALTSWWGKVSRQVLPSHGWKRNPSVYRYTKKRGMDFQYTRNTSKVLRIA